MAGDVIATLWLTDTTITSSFDDSNTYCGLNSSEGCATAILAEGVMDRVSVTATIGGTAKVVGDNYEVLDDNDTITFVADICLDGYAFSHWETLTGKQLGNEMSVRLKKSEIMDNVIVAVFVPVGNGNLNSDLNN